MEYLDKLGVLALGSRLRRLSDNIMADGATMYRQANVDFDPKWFPVFSLLSKQSPLGIMEIADHLNISHPYVIKLVKDLEKKGYLTNAANSSDGRKRAIQLSDAGFKILNELEPLWDDISRTMESLLRDLNNSIYSSIIQLEEAFSSRSFADRLSDTRKERQQASVTILPFSAEYESYFKTLNEEWLKKYFEIEPLDVEVLSNPVEYLIKPGGTILFAEYNGEIVGTCALKKHESNQYELTKMAVTEKVQGLQIGKKLGQAILTSAKEKNAAKVFLESNRILSPAINLYKRLGFVEAIHPSQSDYIRSDIYMVLKADL